MSVKAKFDELITSKEVELQMQNLGISLRLCGAVALARGAGGTAYDKISVDSGQSASSSKSLLAARLT